MKNLFGEDPEIIKTLGFYQPFCTLMLPPFLKIETRQVGSGRKPPFPINYRYAFYSTKEPLEDLTLLKWCGPDLYGQIYEKCVNDPTYYKNGFILGIGTLKRVRPMVKTDEPACFVKMKPKDGKTVWCLEFTDVSRIEPIPFVDNDGSHLGKQGVGNLPAAFYLKIKLIP